MVLDQKIATRQSYGEALAELGEENKNVVVLDADLSGATKTSIFAKEFPERFFDMGIAEQDMMGTGSGLSTFGKIPYVSTFAVFAAGRAYDQIRNTIAHTNANVKICATRTSSWLNSRRSWCNTSNARRYKHDENSSKHDGYESI